MKARREGWGGVSQWVQTEGRDLGPVEPAERHHLRLAFPARVTKSSPVQSSSYRQSTQAQACRAGTKVCQRLTSAGGEGQQGRGHKERANGGRGGGEERRKKEREEERTRTRTRRRCREKESERVRERERERERDSAGPARRSSMAAFWGCWHSTAGGQAPILAIGP